MAFLAWLLLAAAAEARRNHMGGVVGSEVLGPTDGGNGGEVLDPTDVPLQSIYGGCPTNNAVCVVIRMRNPRPEDDCRESCDEVATRLTTSLQPGEDPAMPNGCGRCIAVETKSGGRDQKKHWAYDVIFPYDEVTEKTVTNVDVYTTVVEPTVDQAFGCQHEGGSCKSAAFFAYGASGSGKSYTMGFEPGKRDGLMQLGCQRMFDSLRNLAGQNHPMGSQKVFMTFYEIYGGSKAGPRVFDLLAAKRGTGLKGTRREVVPQLVFNEIESLPTMMSVFAKANKNRQTGGTGMNEVSSRSHAIVELVITDDDLRVRAEKIAKGDKRERAGMLMAINKAVKVMFVDLAGSESAGKWEDQKRQDEGNAINMALGALRSCIAAAADPKLPPCSWRSSPLTMMLHDLFNADKHTKKAKAFTRMIATVNPSADPLQVMHTKSTMQYASTVKSIKIPAPEGKRAVVTKVLPEQVIAQLKAKLASAQARIEELENELAKKQPVENKEVPSGGEGDCEDIQNQLDATKSQLMVKTKELTAERESCKDSMEKAMEELTAKQEETALCNKLLGETDASARMANKQVEEFMQKELKYLEQVDELSAHVAELESGQDVKAAAEVEKRLKACKLLGVSTDVITNWQAKSKLEITLDELSDLQEKQKRRNELLEQLQLQKQQAGKVSFMGWLGQKISDLGAGDKSIGTVQKRLMELDTAIEIVQEAVQDAEEIRQSLLDFGRHFLEGQHSYLESAVERITKEAGGTASGVMLLSTIRDMQTWLKETESSMISQDFDAAAYATEMDKQAQRSICFSRMLLVKNSEGTCPDQLSELEEFCKEPEEVED